MQLTRGRFLITFSLGFFTTLYALSSTAATSGQNPMHTGMGQISGALTNSIISSSGAQFSINQDGKVTVKVKGNQSVKNKKTNNNSTKGRNNAQNNASIDRQNNVLTHNLKASLKAKGLTENQIDEVIASIENEHPT